MSRKFNLADVSDQESDHFYDRDGNPYVIKRNIEMTKADQAESGRLYKLIEEGMKQLNVSSNEQKRANVEALLVKRTLMLIHIIVPDLPEDILNSLSEKEQNAFMEWWGAVQEEERLMRLTASNASEDEREATGKRRGE